MENVKIGYEQVPLEKRVRNRVVSNGVVDPYLRYTKLMKESGKTAAIVSYAAHAATLFEVSDPILSADYPGEMINILEKDSLDG